MKHQSLNGLKTMEQYLDMLQKIYPNVPYENIKKIEKQYKNEAEMNERLRQINDNKTELI